VAASPRPARAKTASDVPHGRGVACRLAGDS